MEKLKYGERHAMNNKDLILKREFSNLISLWKTVLKLIVHKLRVKECEDLLWNAFKTILCDSELYMTCLQFKMSPSAIAIFHEYVSREEVPVLASKGPSSSLPTMATTTCMSSTTAPTTETPADVSASKKSEVNVDSPDLIEDFFGLQNVQTLAQSRSVFLENTIMLAMLSKWLTEAPQNIKQIELVFPVVGHSYIPPDRVFAKIEKKVRRHEVV